MQYHFIFLRVFYQAPDVHTKVMKSFTELSVLYSLSKDGNTYRTTFSTDGNTDTQDGHKTSNHPDIPDRMSYDRLMNESFV